MTLIERLEALDGPSIEVFIEVFAAIHGPKPPRVHGGSQELTDWIVAFTPFYKMMEAGAWTDAAMYLVPDGWWLAGLNYVPADFRTAIDREWHAELAAPVTWAVVEHGCPEEPMYDCEGGDAVTAAIALCIAALRARGLTQ